MLKIHTDHMWLNSGQGVKTHFFPHWEFLSVKVTVTVQPFCPPFSHCSQVYLDAFKLCISIVLRLQKVRNTACLGSVFSLMPISLPVSLCRLFLICSNIWWLPGRYQVTSTHCFFFCGVVLTAKSSIIRHAMGFCSTGGQFNLLYSLSFWVNLVLTTNLTDLIVFSSAYCWVLMTMLRAANWKRAARWMKPWCHWGVNPELLLRKRNLTERIIKGH